MPEILVSRRAVIGSLLATPALSLGCGPMHGTVTRTVDGRQVTEEVEYANYREFFGSVGREFVNPWVKIGKALYAAMKELRRIIKEMIENILRVPEPGTIALTDLDPSFGPFVGGRHDFVSNAEFQYVRLDVPAFDEFFKASMGVFAYTTQLLRSASALREEVGLRSGYAKASKASLPQMVAAARDSASTKDLASVVHAALGPGSSYRQQAQQLGAAGSNLVTSAKRTLVDPRVIVHVDLVVRGVKQSIEVLAKSVKLMLELLSPGRDEEVARY